jgi:uncharacterized protein (DUF488 family)
MDEIQIWTIGFTQKPASKFFSLLKQSTAKRIVDVRLNNVSQLAGFAKRDDLRYFAEEICNMEYVHVPALAPTHEMLDKYKKHGGAWDSYEKQFLGLMRERKIEETLSPDLFRGGCLLCSEDKPHHCHRRLVAEYLQGKWGSSVKVTHLT